MSVNDNREALITRLARAAACRYKRRCWWADAEEMEQEACAAMLGAAPRFDPAVGVPLGGYLWQVAVRSLARFLWQRSSPVSASRNPREKLAGTYHEELDPRKTGDAPGPEAELHARRWRKAVRARLVELGGDPWLLDHLLDGETPRALSARLGIPVGRIYKATARTRKRAGDDPYLYRMLKEEAP